MCPYPWPLLSLTFSSLLFPCIQASSRIQEFPVCLYILYSHLRFMTLNFVRFEFFYVCFLLIFYRFYFMAVCIKRIQGQKIKLKPGLISSDKFKRAKFKSRSKIYTKYFIEKMKKIFSNLLC